MQPAMNYTAFTEAQLRQLMDLYRACTNQDPVIGGCQSILFSHWGKNLCENTARTPPEAHDRLGKGLTIDDVPDDVMFMIMLMLTPRDLCKVSRVSKRWYAFGSHELIWSSLLAKDSKHWNFIVSTGFPDSLRHAEADGRSSKSIYIRCHPEGMKAYPSPAPLKQYSFAALRISKLAPKVLMFGPGLEGRSSGLVKRIIGDEHFAPPCKGFRVTGMVSGTPGGLGSGLSLTLAGAPLDLITLYSEVKAKREATDPDDRLERSKLYSRDDTGKFKVREPVEKLCQEASGFVFVVDDRRAGKLASDWRDELSAMLHSASFQHVPFLVILCKSAVEDGDSPNGCCLGALDTAQLMKLGRLSNQWCVIGMAASDTLDAVREGFSWLLSQIQF